MTPLSLFLIACATVFLGSVQSTFSALMRLSLRLMAERGGRDDRLGQYLDDPLQLFIPVRILIGLCTVLAGVLIARLSTVDDARSIATFFVSLVAFVVWCASICYPCSWHAAVRRRSSTFCCSPFTQSRGRCVR